MFVLKNRNDPQLSERTSMEDLSIQNSNVVENIHPMTSAFSLFTDDRYLLRKTIHDIEIFFIKSRSRLTPKARSRLLQGLSRDPRTSGGTSNIC